MAKTNKPKTKPVAKKTPVNSKKKTISKKEAVSENSLEVVATTASQVTTVSVEFKSGVGQINASLLRKGKLIDTKNINSSGDINFSDVQTGDTISLNGICAGTAKISINIPTIPATPEIFNSQVILTGYLI